MLMKKIYNRLNLLVSGFLIVLSWRKINFCLFIVYRMTEKLPEVLTSINDLDHELIRKTIEARKLKTTEKYGNKSKVGVL